MAFAAPLFLLAALAAAIPVILHLINRQQARDLPFPTLRFLLSSVQKTRRRRRIHDLLLMLLRIAALVCLAIGLSKPTLTSLRSLLGGADSAVAIVLDNSASMGMVDHGALRFETARRAAYQILREVRDGDQVAVWIPCGPEFPDTGRLARTKEAASQALDNVQISYERADVALAVADAQKVLATAEAANRVVYVLSDMQTHGWDTLKAKDENPKPDSELTKEQQKILDTPIVLVDCHRAPKPNVAVTGVETKAMVPVAGLPIQATVELFNAAPTAQPCHVELYVDGSKVASSPDLEIPPNERFQHEFEFQFDRGGLHRCEVRLAGSDGSRFDDRRFFTMEVDQGIPVAIVKPRHHEIPYLEDTYYVERALAPAGASNWALTTTMLTAEALVSEPLSNYTVLFCVNLPEPSAAAAERLARYVAGGGHIIWFCGENVEATPYNRMNEAADGQLLPTPLIEIRQPIPGEDRDSWKVTFLDREHPALGHLVEPASLYESILVYKHARLDAAEGAWIMARLDDGEPLIVSRPVEEGSVTMIGTSAHVGWTNLPLRPIFLPLLARMAFDLAGAEQARHATLAGTPIILQFEGEIPPSAIEILPPSGATIRQPTTDEQGRRQMEFRYAQTHDIGVYLLRQLQGVRPVQTTYSVNVDPDEALADRVDAAELQKRFGQIPVVVAEDPDDLTATFEQLREGESLWSHFLWLVLAVLVLETYVSNRLSPTKENDELKKLPPGMRRLAKQSK